MLRIGFIACPCNSGKAFMRNKPKPAWATVIAGMTISLIQTGRNNFTVTYWKDVNDKLTYNQACDKLGQCILHALACESKLDNREKGEN